MVALTAATLSCNSPEATKPATPTVIGEIKQVMREGRLEGAIHLDSIADKDHLYGMGPVEFLGGEILILDGSCFVSRLQPDSSVGIEQHFDVRAPFFAYARVESWKEHPLPSHLSNMQELETYLDSISREHSEPFFFRLTGSVDEALVHIVNLPKGRELRSMKDAHEGRVQFAMQDVQSEILGFFSRRHQSVFTHHDSYLHMHLISNDLKMMGHVDGLAFSPDSMRLYLADA